MSVELTMCMTAPRFFNRFREGWPSYSVSEERNGSDFVSLDTSGQWYQTGPYPSFVDRRLGLCSFSIFCFVSVRIVAARARVPGAVRSYLKALAL